MPLRGLRRFLAGALSPAEIETVARAAVAVGFRKVRLTGGEPTLRPTWSDRGTIGGVAGSSDLAMTTNGILLPRLARPCRDAGLRRLNIHVDTLHPDSCDRLMRFGLRRGDPGPASRRPRQAGLGPDQAQLDGDARLRRWGRRRPRAARARARLARALHRADAAAAAANARTSLSQYVSNAETRRRRTRPRAAEVLPEHSPRRTRPSTTASPAATVSSASSARSAGRTAAPATACA